MRFPWFRRKRLEVQQLVLWEAPALLEAHTLDADTAATDWPELDGPPLAAAQRAVLARVAAALEPLIQNEGLGNAHRIEPGLRLRRTYGRCTWYAATKSALIQVRCTADNDPKRWRRIGAITGTLLHELAHLRYRSHGPRFWTLYRRLVNRAVAAGLYDPSDRDPVERPRGERKLGTRYALRSSSMETTRL